MTILSRDIAQHTADVVVAATIPANALIWLTDIDVLLRICVSLGTLVLIGFAIAAKWHKWRH